MSREQFAEEVRRLQDEIQDLEERRLLNEFPYINDLARLGALLELPVWREPSELRENVESYRIRLQKMFEIYRNGLGTLEAGELGLLAVLMVSSLLSLVYLLEIPLKAFFSKPDFPPEHEGIHEAPLLCVLPPVVTALGGIVLFFFAGDVWRLLTGMVP